MSEIWKDIKGFEGYYQVSNLSRVKSLSRTVYRRKSGAILIKEGYLTPNVDKVGYERVTLYGKEFSKRFFVHRLVAEYFIENPNKRSIINHKNGIKTDNRIENLEWCTQKENINHSFLNKLQVPYKGEECSFAVLNEKKVRRIRELWKTREYTQKDIGQMFGVTRGAIKGITLNKNWKHVI